MHNNTDPSAATPRAAAVVFEHGDDADAAMAVAVASLRHAGLRVGGLLQVFGPALGPCKREMNLLVLASGEWIRLDEPRGPEAQGCTLDADALTRAAVALREAVRARPDLLVVSRFGKQEALGGGMRAEIAEALMSGIPVLVAGTIHAARGLERLHRRAVAGAAGVRRHHRRVGARARGGFAATGHGINDSNKEVTWGGE